MIRYPLLLLALLLPGALRAEQGVTLVRCAPGGCSCAPSGLTPEQVAAKIGVAAPEDGPEAVLLELDGALSWSPATPQRLDLEMGGDGICQPARELLLRGAASAVPGNAAPAAPGAQPDAAAPARTAIDPAIGACPMTPLDGTWQPALVEDSQEDCPQEMRALLGPMMAPSLAPRAIAWGGAFDPERLSIGASGIRWTQIGPCNYIGRVRVPGAAALKAKIDYQANLVSPRQAAATLRVDIGMDADDATTQTILAQAGLAACAARLRFEVRRISD